MISVDDIVYIARNIPRDVVAYEIRPRTILSCRSRLGIREAIVSFPVEDRSACICTPKYLLGRACRMRHVDIIWILLTDPRVDPSVENNEAIHEASEYGHTEVVKLLLADPRVDPSDMYNRAIREASTNGHTEVVKLLLADPRVDVSSAACAALSDPIHRMPSDGD